MHKLIQPPHRVSMRRHNDCYTACYASILGVKYEEVPRFWHEHDEPIGDWLTLRDSFLKQFNLQSVTLALGESDLLLTCLKGLLIVSVEATLRKYKDMGAGHAVIWKDGALWHDPFPMANLEYTRTPLSVELLIPILGSE